MTKEYYIKIGFSEEAAEITAKIDQAIEDYLTQRNEAIAHCYKKNNGKLKYSWDHDVNYEKENKLICKNCKHCCIGVPIKIIVCDIMKNPNEKGECPNYEKSNR